MGKVIITSENPNKIEAVKNAFLEAFRHIDLDFVAVSVESGVASLPRGQEEIERGARTRVENAREVYSDADYYIGIEGGILPFGSSYGVTTFVVAQNHEGVCGMAQSSICQLPQKVMSLIDDDDYGLGDAIDKLSNDTNSKRKGGAVAFLTRGLIQRSEQQRTALISALVPFLRPDLYTK